MVEKLTESQMTGIKDAFTLFDTDGDGSISVKELGKVIRSLGQNPTDAEIINIISKADSNRNGTIEFDEFVVMMSHRMKSVSFEDDVKKTFDLFDKNGDGFITTKELRRVLSCLKINMTDGEIDTMLRETDFDHDGRVSYDEFLLLVKTK
jgi:calmodulin